MKRYVGLVPSMAKTFCTNADNAPSLPGAYILAVEITESVKVTILGKPEQTLHPGHYFYCGSAWGPGGLRARLARHMRRGKTVRWHIDRLTEAGEALGAWVFPRGHECDLVAALWNLPVPIIGFGSTDCARCRSHLLQWTSSTPPEIDLHFLQAPRAARTDRLTNVSQGISRSEGFAARAAKKK